MPSAPVKWVSAYLEDPTHYGARTRLYIRNISSNIRSASELCPRSPAFPAIHKVCARVFKKTPPRLRLNRTQHCYWLISATYYNGSLSEVCLTIHRIATPWDWVRKRELSSQLTRSENVTWNVKHSLSNNASSSPTSMESAYLLFIHACQSDISLLQNNTYHTITHQTHRK